MMSDESKLSGIYSNAQDDGMGGMNLQDLDPKKFQDKWTGKVINNKDPLKMGRVRVRIFGLYDDVMDTLLPWALPEQKYLGASTSNLIIPENDAIIRGYFENGDPFKPIYEGMITVENPVEVAIRSFTGLRKPGDSILDEATNDLDYPDVMVLFKTDDGDGLTVNRSDGTFKFVHRSGLKMLIDPDGSLTIEQGMSLKFRNPQPAHMDVKLEGAFNLTANGEVNIDAKKNVNINSVLGDVNELFSRRLQDIPDLGSTVFNAECSGKRGQRCIAAAAEHMEKVIADGDESLESAAFFQLFQQ